MPIYHCIKLKYFTEILYSIRHIHKVQKALIGDQLGLETGASLVHVGLAVPDGCLDSLLGIVGSIINLHLQENLHKIVEGIAVWHLGGGYKMGNQWYGE